jgi:hypothetical protein
MTDPSLDLLGIGDPPRRNTGPQPTMETHTAAFKILVSVMGGLILLVAGGIVQKSCSSCLAMGTWSPPYQPIEAAKSQAEANSAEHATIRRELTTSVESLRAEITTGNREIIKAISEQKKPGRPR